MSGALLGWFAALGCGSSEKSGSSSGAGGTSATTGPGGTSAGTAGSAGASSGGTSGSGGSSGGGSGGTSLGTSLTDSCIAYALASCERNAECGGYTTECLGSTFRCPDVVTSPGSTRTAEGLRACAEEYKTFPCESLLNGELPPCVTPGTHQVGEPCLFASQCQTLACDRSEGGCGVCYQPPGEGEDCSVTGVCQSPFVCDGSICTTAGPTGSVAQEGESCVTATCEYNLDCDPSTQTCVPYPGLNESCAEARTCDFEDGSYCELNGLLCKAHPGLGQPCGVDGFTGVAGYCAEGTICHRTSVSTGTCEAPAALGQPCFTDPETSEPVLYSCGTSGRCDASVTPAVCVARLNAGESCDPALYPCSPGLSCLCVDDFESCAQGVCGTLRLGGQSCTGPGDVCHPGYTCSGGSCVPRDSQGLFAATCP